MKGHPLVIKTLAQPTIDWLASKGVSPKAMIQTWSGHSSPIMSAHGELASDGRFDPDPAGKNWLVFEEEYDRVFWRQKSGGLATFEGRSFALGEEMIDNPATTAFDQWLCIYVDPLQWLQHERDGIVVIKWDFAFDRLRDVTRIAVAEPMLATYRRCMRPSHMPKLAVLPTAERLSA
jgi:hypothetical protein